MSHTIGNAIRGLYNAVFRPARLVTAHRQYTEGSLDTQLRQSRKLLTVYLVNLALYAGPLTLAGIGIGATVPEWLTPVVGAEPSTAVLLLGGFLENSLYLFGVTVATLFGIHFALLVTLQSRGFLRTAYSIVYSTSVYLAAIFTVVWYLTTADGVENARTFVINLQVEFIYRVIDLLGAGISFGVARPETLVPAGFSEVGGYALVALAVLLLYYLYSLYLGTRLNHDAGRFEGVVVLLVVLSLPVLYVVGSIAITMIQ
ncbi:hypothetical protein SAMN04487949_3843 [Halogranum gelatinilyticum]|uniref:Yip1 domain-containing protein n=1 Tax=Halogranum gelatinilyticum TaxID=660521 RepID=A0A1H0A594_9EURY|nr:hypothetical protein [Halogranum gelatinilyticum]SDN28962.1 hypothetical protein SAMN04487949_3843 [Halogranum gelatinilyticum]